jgi:serine/threonine-protein kinase
MLGTPNYISPEQAIGQPATGASDLYALGVVAHEMLTGKRPFDRGTPIATALCHVNEPPPPLGEDVPEDLRDVVASLLEKDPEDRPDNALAVAVSLGVAPAEVADVDVDLASGVPSGYVVLPVTPLTPSTPLEAVSVTDDESAAEPGESAARPADRAPADLPTMAAGPEELLD